jgi:hypothetical protein
MVGSMTLMSEVHAETTKSLRQARKLAKRENNVEALIAIANIGLQFSVARSGGVETGPSLQVGFGGSHD